MHAVKESYRKQAESKSQECDTLQAENTQLRQFLEQAVATFGAEQKKLKSKLAAAEKANVAAGKKPMVPPAPPAAATPSQTQAVVDELLTEVARQFHNMAVKEESKLHKKKKPTPAAATAAAPAVPQLYAFRFNDPTNGGWINITDPTMISELTDLVTQATSKVTYNFGGNSYEAELATSGDPAAQPGEYTITQTNTSHPAHTVRILISSVAPTASPPPPSAPPKAPVEDLIPVAKTVLYQAPFIQFGTRELDDWYTRVNANDDIVERVSPELSDLATSWSHYASDFKYDSKQSILRVNPRSLKLWLELARGRGMTKVRIVIHGSSNYDSLKKDPVMYNPQYNRQGCAKGFAYYVTPSDHLARDYNAGLPDGSGVFGFLLVHDRDGDMGLLGSYENYKLTASSTPSGILSSQSCTLAIAVRDLNLCINMGIAVSTGKRVFMETATGAAGASGS